jgi:chromate transport protein ChrA
MKGAASTTAPGHPANRLVSTLAEGGLLLWVTVTVGIWAWTFHLLFLASFVRLACSHPVVEWVFHGVTAATAAPTVAGIAACLLLMRHCGDPEDAGTVAGRTRFLGIVGLLVNAISLALILAEGVYVPFLDPCR